MGGVDFTRLIASADEFLTRPVPPSDAAAKEFLDRYPIPILLNALGADIDDHIPGSQVIVAGCLERLFGTRYGASLIPQYASFLQAGLQSNSQSVRWLACRAVSSLLKNIEDCGITLSIMIGYNIYPLLVNCLVEGDERASAASLDAIKHLAQVPDGLKIIFPEDGQGLQLKKITANCSSLGRIRILSLIAKLFNLSSSVGLEVHKSNLLGLFEAEIDDRNDILTTLSALELLHEVVESPYSSSFLSGNFLRLLTDLINFSEDSVLRSRAMLISGRLLSTNDAYKCMDLASVARLLQVINGKLEELKAENSDECEIALEALGQIGTSNRGASLLLAGAHPVAGHVIESAFGLQFRGKQLAALHALGSICGVNRPDDSRLLDENSEDSLRHMIYTSASLSPKLTPSGLLVSVLQQIPEIRLATYRLIAALVSRKWCLTEVCSEGEIISILTDANSETQKNGMDARHHCCVAILNALSDVNMVSDFGAGEVLEKFQEAVRRGPYRIRRHTEPQPVVMTAERF